MAKKITKSIMFLICFISLVFSLSACSSKGGIADVTVRNYRDDNLRYCIAVEVQLTEDFLEEYEGQYLYNILYHKVLLNNVPDVRVGHTIDAQTYEISETNSLLSDGTEYTFIISKSEYIKKDDVVATYKFRYSE